MSLLEGVFLSGPQEPYVAICFNLGTSACPRDMSVNRLAHGVTFMISTSKK